MFKYFRPKQHSVDVIKKNEIYMCRPSCYEDTGDCAYIADNKAIAKYYIEEYKKEVYKTYAPLLKDGFYSEIANKMESNKKYKEFIHRFQNEALIACISNRFDDLIWEYYSNNSSGFCAVYNTREIIIQSPRLGFYFYPVRYVENRNKCIDIKFSANDYKDDKTAFLSYTKKHHLSCLTKDIIPYSQEGEWRLIHYNPDISDVENGKQYPFIKPLMIVAGKNMDIHSDLYESLSDISTERGIMFVNANIVNDILKSYITYH